MRHAFSLLPRFFAVPVLLGCAFLSPLLYATTARADAARDTTQNELRTQQAKVQSNQERISRMTQEERTIDGSLAKLEDQLKALEDRLGMYRTRMTALSKTDDGLQQQLMLLQRQKKITADSLAQAQKLLWQMETRRQAVGQRDPTTWPVADREATWVATLHTLVREHYAAQAEQEMAITKTITDRDTVLASIITEQEAAQEEKIALLEASTNYRRRIATLRQEKSNTESEVQATLSLVKKLNLALSQYGKKTTFPKLKGLLPWPVDGTIVQRFAPEANPACRGIALTTTGGKRVRSVAYGKVVHNDILRGFGRVVVLLHGEDYYSLYAFLSESSLRIGQEVASEETIGTVGFYPQTNSNGLYFELRFHQKVINPEQWLAKKI